MSTAFKLNKYLNSFFKLNLKNADKELYNSIEQEFFTELESINQLHNSYLEGEVDFNALLDSYTNLNAVAENLESYVQENKSVVESAYGPRYLEVASATKRATENYLYLANYFLEN